MCHRQSSSRVSNAALRSMKAISMKALLLAVRNTRAGQWR